MTTFTEADSALEKLSERAQAQFAEAFCGSASVVVAAPGRVNLIGEHVDYNDGFVLPLAIDRRVVIAGRAVEGDRGTLASASQRQRATFRLDDGSLKTGEPRWANYVKGVVAGFRGRGIAVPGFEVWVETDLPTGAGLSSSAALEVAMATFCEVTTGHTLAPADKARLCQTAEHEFAGVPCGLMDQFASVHGRADHAMLMDCQAEVIREFVPLDPAYVILVADTGVRHALADGEYAKRRAACAEALVALGARSWREVSVADLGRLSGHQLRRARHVVSEIARAQDAARALAGGDWATVGDLMAGSHRSLRDDFEVSCVELDLLVALAAGQPGVVGARMTGGGFGGSTVTLVRREMAEGLAERMRGTYKAETGIDATIFPVRAAGGATVLVNREGEG
ncbi:galactokinase [soil metagenome]